MVWNRVNKTDSKREGKQIKSKSFLLSGPFKCAATGRCAPNLKGVFWKLKWSRFRVDLPSQIFQLRKMHDKHSHNYLHTSIHKRFFSPVREQPCGVTWWQPLMATNKRLLTRNHEKTVFASNRSRVVSTDFHDQYPWWLCTWLIVNIKALCPNEMVQY